MKKKNIIGFQRDLLPKFSFGLEVKEPACQHSVGTVATVEGVEFLAWELPHALDVAKKKKAERGLLPRRKGLESKGSQERRVTMLRGLWGKLWVPLSCHSSGSVLGKQAQDRATQRRRTVLDSSSSSMPRSFQGPGKPVPLSLDPSSSF